MRSWVIGLVMVMGCSSSPAATDDAGVVSDGQVSAPAVLRPGRYTGTYRCQAEPSQFRNLAGGDGAGVASCEVMDNGAVRFSCASRVCPATAAPSSTGGTALTLQPCEHLQGVESNVRVRYLPAASSVTSEGGRIIVRASWTLSADLDGGAAMGTASVTETLNPEPVQ